MLCDGEIAASGYEEMGRGQAERLIPMLDELLAKAGADWNQLHGLGVGVGPGNFTGIRLSVSAARGLALSLGIKAIGVSTFDALTFGISTPAIASVEAPRDQIYAQVVNQKGADPVLGHAETIRLDAPSRAEPICIGHQAAVLATRFAGHVQSPGMPLAEAIANVAALRLNNSNYERPTPLYIRPADAAPPSDPPPVILP